MEKFHGLLYYGVPTLPRMNQYRMFYNLRYSLIKANVISMKVKYLVLHGGS